MFRLDRVTTGAEPDAIGIVIETYAFFQAVAGSTLRIHRSGEGITGLRIARFVAALATADGLTDGFGLRKSLVATHAIGSGARQSSRVFAVEIDVFRFPVGRMRIRRQRRRLLSICSLTLLGTRNNKDQ